MAHDDERNDIRDAAYKRVAKTMSEMMHREWDKQRAVDDAATPVPLPIPSLRLMPTGTDSKRKEPLQEGDSEVKGTLRSKLDALVASTRETNPELAGKQARLLNIIGNDINADELLTQLGLPPSKPR